FGHSVEVSRGERNSNPNGPGEPRDRVDGRVSDKVPTVATDIPVIHRLVTKNFASATRKRCAWCSCDRDGGPGLSKSRQRQAGAAGDQRSDLRRQAVERAFGF